MSIDDIIASPKIYLTPADIAPILHCDPQCIRAQAQSDPSKLGFPLIIVGTRVKVPRIPFLRFLGYIP